MKERTQFIIQAVATLTQVVNAMGWLVPKEYVYYVSGSLASIQFVAGAIAHRYNPDGTSARLPWEGSKEGEDQ